MEVAQEEARERRASHGWHFGALRSEGRDTVTGCGGSSTAFSFSMAPRCAACAMERAVPRSCPRLTRRGALRLTRRWRPPERSCGRRPALGGTVMQPAGASWRRFGALHAHEEREQRGARAANLSEFVGSRAASAGSSERWEQRAQGAASAGSSERREQAGRLPRGVAWRRCVEALRGGVAC